MKVLAKQHVDDIIAAASAKEKAPETPTVVLPGRPVEAAAAPPSTPGPAVTVASSAPAPAPTTVPPAGPVPKPDPVATKTASSAAEYHAQGRKLIQDEKFAQAIVPLSEAVALDPNMSTALKARGYCNAR